jgi:hypothetical protein
MLHFFLEEASKMRGVMSLGFLPLSQGELQNGAIFLLAIVIVVEA